MTAHLIGQNIEPTEDRPPSVLAAIARARARHAEHCPHCTCAETIRVESIVDAIATTDVDDVPSAITTHRRPVVAVDYHQEKK